MNIILILLWSTVFCDANRLSLKGEEQFPIYLFWNSQNSVVENTLLPNEILDMSFQNISNLNSTYFAEMTDLKLINVSFNNIEELEDGLFKTTRKLKYLDLSHNELHNVSCEFLVCLPELEYLDISSNKFMALNLGSAFKSVVNLKFLRVSAEKLQRNYLKNIAGIRLNIFFIEIMKPWSYEKNSLDWINTNTVVIEFPNDNVNKVDAFLSDVLEISTNIEIIGSACCLDFSNASSNSVSFNLTNMYLTNFQISLVCFLKAVKMFSELKGQKLQVYNLTVHIMNDELIIPEVFLPFEALSVQVAKTDVLSFTASNLYNNIINMKIKNMKISETPLFYITCPRTDSIHEVLDFSDNFFSDEIFSSPGITACKTFPLLHTLILKGNKLMHLDTLSVRTQHMKALTELDASFNMLTSESRNCYWPLSLSKLNLSFNTLDSYVFHCIPIMVQILDLQYNQITSIPQDMVSLNALKEIILSSNRLFNIPDCKNFHFVELLFLSSNVIKTPSADFLDSCQILKHLDISRNPFICDCSLRHFLQNRDKSKLALLGWPNLYSCSEPEALNGTLLEDFHMFEISCNLALLLAAILIPLIVIVISIAVLCKHFDAPWYLRMMWQWTQTKQRAKTKQLLETRRDLAYNAFVSYSQDDSSWVKEYLLPNLEEMGTLKICYHERNFIAGKSIIENIITCIEKSYKSIFVLSTNFISSEWCHYELYFAQHQLLSENTENLILILLEPIPHYMIPSKYYKLKDLMSRKTYMEWPKDKNKHKLFWASLRSAIHINLSELAAR
ncbi:toll-like receptor 6 [Erpetoichthys calabaricus]|uniref:toll-like receptor 6 n=1 Tax=Erpetoichthys calabaricus TaxID=27687 RepID=UPI002234CE60|nr:toll-like receptor 6 [Erpetoichthys calabaricus]XP_051784159.1 toll-like receptor 6 [Erpetoichthys calabaricus]